MPPDPLLQEKWISMTCTPRKMQDRYGFVRWIGVGSYLVWTGSWKIILIKSPGIFFRHLESEQDSPKALPLWALRYSLHFFWFSGLFRIFVSRRLQTLCLLLTCGWHWFMFKFIFDLTFCLPSYPGDWFRWFKSHIQKPSLFHAPLAANISSLTQSHRLCGGRHGTAGLHWRPLLRELCQRRVRRGEPEDTRGTWKSRVSARPPDSPWNCRDLEEPVSNRNEKPSWCTVLQSFLSNNVAFWQHLWKIDRRATQEEYASMRKVLCQMRNER